MSDRDNKTKRRIFFYVWSSQPFQVIHETQNINCFKWNKRLSQNALCKLLASYYCKIFTWRRRTSPEVRFFLWWRIPWAWQPIRLIHYRWLFPNWQDTSFCHNNLNLLIRLRKESHSPFFCILTKNPCLNLLN